jgi:hypothetical protein
MSRIFLSHSSVDELEAVALKHWLADNGWDEEDVFLDVDPERGLVAGERWQEALRKAADRCEAVVLLVTPAWAKSKWCLAEFLLAKNLHKHIFGVILKDVPISELPIEMTSEWQLCQLVGSGPDETVCFRHREIEYAISFQIDGLRRFRNGLKRASTLISFPGRPKTILTVRLTVAWSLWISVMRQYSLAATWKSCEDWMPCVACVTTKTRNCSSYWVPQARANPHSCVPVCCPDWRVTTAIGHSAGA